MAVVSKQMLKLALRISGAIGLKKREKKFAEVSWPQHFPCPPATAEDLIKMH